MNIQLVRLMLGALLLLSTMALLAACGSDEGEAEEVPAVALEELAAPPLVDDQEAFRVAAIGEPVTDDVDIELGYSLVEGLGFLTCSDDGQFYTLYTEQGAEDRVVLSLPPDIGTGEHELIGIGDMDGFGTAAGELVLNNEEFYAVEGEGTLTIDSFPESTTDTFSGSFELLVGRGEDRVRLAGAFRHNNIGALCE